MIERLLNILAIDAPSNKRTGLPEVAAGEGSFQNLLAIVFGLAAALAVLSIVVAGFNFVTGGDDPDKLSRAKKTIIFSFVGLAIALTAEFIVLTVLGSF